MVKIGVVGLGFMGSTHLQAYEKIGNAELAAVASSDPKKLGGDLSGIGGNLEVQGTKLDFGDAKRYSTADQLFGDPAVEAVDLCLPTYLHASMAIAALNAGKHVLVEKPMGLSGEECDSMIAAARSNGKVLMVAQVIRFWPDYVAARDMVNAGEIGTVRSAAFRRRCSAPAWSEWLRDRERSGGGAFDLLIHDFDYCVYLFGKPDAVSAAGHEDLEGGVDLVDCRLRYQDGPTVTVDGGWHNRGEYPFSMEFTIVGDDGVLEFHSSSQRLKLYRADGTQEEPSLPEGDGFQGELEAFIQACEQGEAPRDCRPEDSALSTRVALAMRTSRERGGEAVAV